MNLLNQSDIFYQSHLPIKIFVFAFDFYEKAYKRMRRKTNDQNINIYIYIQPTGNILITHLHTVLHGTDQVIIKRYVAFGTKSLDHLNKRTYVVTLILLSPSNICVLTCT